MQLHMHEDGMKLKKFLIVIITIFQFTQFIGFFSLIQISKADTPPTLYVGSQETYTRIQDALDDAADGYRIFVYNGTYNENLIINNRIDLFGEERSNTIIRGNRTSVIIVNADNVNISHFTIKNNNPLEASSLIHVNGLNSIITDNIISNGYYGIHLYNTDNHLIYDNVITNNSGDGIRLYQSYNNVNISFNSVSRNKNGIYLYESDGIQIYSNELQYNNQSGIFLNSTCQDNTIRKNNASQNGVHGIYLNDYSNYQTIVDNQIFYNKNSGLVLENCSMNFNIDGNTVIGNINYGMMIIGSTNNISNNLVSYNKKDGMYFSADDHNMIYKNTITYNTLAGIRMYNSTYNYIRNNRIGFNQECGVYLDFFTIHNLIYNNYFHDNTKNAIDKSINRNRWNITRTTGTNIIEGATLYGNYWDDFDESSEGAIDDDSDGVADVPYTIYALNTDKGPILDMIKPWIQLPVAAPVSQTLGRNTNLTVLITDNTIVKEVYLNVTGPNGQRFNTSITQNKTGDTYYCNKIFPSTGNYTFFIAARDPRNWNSSANQTFSIRPAEKPTVKDNSPLTAKPSKKFTFNATVTSKNAVASDLQVFVVWSHGTISNNSTMVISRGNYFVATVTLAHSIENLTYHFYATDKWGSSVVTQDKKIKVIDTEPPVIHVNRYGPSVQDFPNSYTFEATITDDSIISTVTIEYWYNNSNKMKTNMDSITNNRYKKVIIFDNDTPGLFCIINASDIAGNKNDTRNPIACHNGPYNGFILQEVLFNGSKSFDLDGTITTYSWDFGDGTTANNSLATHVYYSTGTYTVTLTVTDDQGRKGTNQTRVTVIPFSQHMIPLDQLALINTRYNLNLSEPFFCYDSDGNGVVDKFVDPAQILTSIHDKPVNFNGNTLFLISIGEDAVPEFFWETTTDLIFPVTHTIGMIQNKIVDDLNEQAKLSVTVDKGQWIYIEIDDPYPHAPITITTKGRIISADNYWRKNQKIYVFDDPETIYEFLFSNIFPPLSVVFSPADGGVIDGDYPTIKITYNEPVTIISAIFNQNNIDDELIRLDDKSYLYTPPGYLENGTYDFEIQAQALQGKGYLVSSVVYFYFSYEPAPQKSFLENNWFLILTGILVGMIGGMLIFFRMKGVTIDGFIYLRNRKIIPFFKSVIVGPVSIQIPQEQFSKAEFYVDGQLKDEVTSFPVRWQWNEKAFLKHTLETKIYDQEGNSTSSGELEFYIFNPLKGK